jgi:hypothetical protein
VFAHIESGPARNQHGGMARLLVMCSDPMYVSGAEAEAWLREEIRLLLDVDDIDHLRLTRLARPSERHAQPWDWLLEIELRPDAEHVACADEPLVADWLRDLRLLGMRPVQLAAGEPVVLEREEG